MAACKVVKRRHHALAVPLPGQGHLNPMMRFCQRLAAQEGFIVTFVQIENAFFNTSGKQPLELLRHRPAIEHRKEEQLQGGGGVDIRRVHISMPDLDARPEGAGFLECFFAALNGVAPQIEELLLQPHEPPITCLISDLFITGPTQSLADKFSLPRIALYPSSQSLLLLANHIQEGALSLEDVLMALEARENLKNNIFKEGLPGLPSLKVRDLIQHNVENRFMYSFGLQYLQETKSKSCAIVVNTSKELEEEALKVDIGIPVYGIGPLVEPLEKEINMSFWQEDEGCMPWLDCQPRSSVLFISFGSFASLSLSQFEEFIAALLASEQRFLLVVRSNLVNDDPLATTFPEELMSNSDGKGYATHWAPQIKVLCHPSTHGFLTHCGWNSTLEAISHGVPMICYPYFADQFLNAKFIIEEWKIGLGFDDDKSGVIGRQEIQRVIRTLFHTQEGERLHTNAKSLMEACSGSFLSGGDAFQNIQSIIQLLK